MEKIGQLLKLNGEQAEIVRSRAPRVAVSAGAGTGKTRLLVARYLTELESGESDIPSIVTITFTENAAAELRDRIAASIGLYVREFGERGNLTGDAPGKLSAAPICTIHGLAARIAGENLLSTDFPAGFKIADRNESEAAVKKSVLEAVLKLRRVQGPASQSLADLLENESFNLDTVLENIASIILGSSEKHLPHPLKRPEIKSGCSQKTVKKLLTESRGLFSSTHARKRFAVALGKVSGPAPASVICRNLKDAAAEMAGIEKMKSAEEAEKSAAAKIRICAYKAVDLLNAQLTEHYLTVAEEAAKRWAGLKIQNSLIDYEDILTQALKVLETNGAALSRYRKLFNLIMVDEFQDTDSLQNGIIELLHGDGAGKLIIVGDKMQSIYGFRGAEPELFGSALGSPEVERFHLSTNYRTSSKLMDCINGLFKNILDNYKPMKADRDAAGALVTFPAEGGNAEEKREKEAALIAEKVSQLAETGGYSYGDIALIFRRSGSMETYERALRRAGLPFKRIGKTKFFDLAETRDLVSMMKFINNPLDERAEAAVLRSPFFGISDKGLALYFSEKRRIKASSYGVFLKRLAADGDEEPRLAARYLLSIVEEKEKINASSPLAAAQFAAYSLGYAAGALALRNGRLIRSNIIKFVEICGHLSEKGTGLAEAINLFDARKGEWDETPAPDETEDSVTLMTCHASKGLEFPVLFLADTNYPPPRHRNNIAISSKRGVMVCHDQCGFGTWKEMAVEGNDDEEKRILYVAMTRAADLIFTQRHRNPYRSSLAHIIESGIGELSGFAGKACGEPPVIPKTKDWRDKAAEEKKNLRKITGENLRPIFEREESELPRNQFRSVSKAEEGEIIHRFFEIWDFSPHSIESLAEFVTAERFVSLKSVRKKIDRCARNALESPLAEMVKKAQSLYREYEFTLETGAGSEKEIRSGKIDLLLENERGTVLVDYKYTDSFAEGKYAEQIEFYNKAVKKIYGKEPVECYICMLPDAVLKNV